MTRSTITILGINPGTKYLAVSVFRGSELREWMIKVFKGKWSSAKKKKILAAIKDLMDKYQPSALAVKRLHPSRSSRHLDSLVLGIVGLAKGKKLVLSDYSVKQLERFFGCEDEMNKRKMAKQVALEYPILFGEFSKEKRCKNNYYNRLFEAVALGSACGYRLKKT